MHPGENECADPPLLAAAAPGESEARGINHAGRQASSRTARVSPARDVYHRQAQSSPLLSAPPGRAASLDHRYKLRVLPAVRCLRAFVTGSGCCPSPEQKGAPASRRSSTKECHSASAPRNKGHRVQRGVYSPSNAGPDVIGWRKKRLFPHQEARGTFRVSTTSGGTTRCNSLARRERGA